MLRLRPALALAIQQKQFAPGEEPPAEPWTPSDIASLYFWGDFNDTATLWQDAAGTTPVTTTGDPIGRVTDHNGGAVVLTQATAGSKPAYTTNVLNGEAVSRHNSDTLVGAFGEILTQPLTLVAVANIGGSSQYVMDGDDTTRRVALYVPSGGKYGMFAGSNFESTITRNGNFALMVGRFNGASSYMRANGREAIGNPGANSLDGLRLGSRWDAGAAMLVGDIRHVFVFNGLLSADDLSRLEGWLRTETGVTDGYSDHKFQIGGDAGQTSGFDPVRRKFWRFGSSDVSRSVIQWVDVDTWVAGQSFTTIPVSTGGCVWHADQSLFYIYGGMTNSGDTTVNTIYSFNPVTEVLTLLTETMPTAHRQPGAAVHPSSGKVYLFGGSGANTDTIAVHDPVAGTCTDTTANMPQVISGVGAVWAPNISKFVLIGGSDQTTDYADILTYDPATPAVNPVDTGVNVSTHGRENLHGAYYNGSIYIFGGYSYELTTYYNLIERIDLSPSVSCTLLAETTHRADDDATAHYDSVTGKIFVGPWLHSSQVTDNNGPDKRVILEFDPDTETLTAEPSLT